MKKHVLFYILFSLIVISSCKRYGYDPLTLRTPLNRITGTWEMTKYEIDGVDSLGLVDLPYTKMVFNREIDIGKSRLLYVYGYSAVFHWSLNSDKSRIGMIYPIFPFYVSDTAGKTEPELLNYFTSSWEIMELTNNKMTLKTGAEIPKNYYRNYTVFLEKISNNEQNEY